LNKFKTEIKWGLIFSASILVWAILERMFGLHGTHIDKHPTYSNLFALVAITLYVLALRDKRGNDLYGKMSYKDGLLSGFIISMVVMVLSPMAQIITHYVITPDYFSNAISYSVEQELHTQASAEDYFSTKNYIIQSTLFAPIMGIITSAIVAFFLKSKPENSEE